MVSGISSKTSTKSSSPTRGVMSVSQSVNLLRLGMIRCKERKIKVLLPEKNCTVRKVDDYFRRSTIFTLEIPIMYTFKIGLIASCNCKSTANILVSEWMQHFSDYIRDETSQMLQLWQRNGWRTAAQRTICLTRSFHNLYGPCKYDE